LEAAVREANERLSTFHSLERQSVRSALIEERGRLCLFVCGLKPVMVSMLRPHLVSNVTFSTLRVTNEAEFNIYLDTQWVILVAFVSGHTDKYAPYGLQGDNAC